MNIKLIYRIFFSSLISLAWSFLWSNSSSAKTEDITLLQRRGMAEIVASNPQEGVTFSCSQAIDPDSEDRTIPATVATIPQRQETINLIFWKTEYFAAWQPQTRCETVSPKFQTFHKDGRLKYLTHGTISGYPVICAVTAKDEGCNGDNQLFQVKPNNDPQLVLRQLMDVIDGKVDERVIYESTDGSERLYISVEEFLDD